MKKLLILAFLPLISFYAFGQDYHCSQAKKKTDISGGITLCKKSVEHNSNTENDCLQKPHRLNGKKPFCKKMSKQTYFNQKQSCWVDRFTNGWKNKLLPTAPCRK